jgi:hypothetical protein
MTTNTQVTACDLYLAIRALTDARTALWKAQQAHIEATAKEAAENGVPWVKFVEACVANASTASATSSGGADAAHNIVEAVAHDAWLAAANDIHTKFLFKEMKNDA